MKFFNRVFLFISTISLLIISSGITVASVDERIILNDPDLFDKTLNQPYDLESMDLRLPEIDMELLNTESQNKLINLISLYGSRENIKIDKESDLVSELDTDKSKDYSLKVDNEVERKVISMNPLPGMSVNADYNKGEEDNKIKENTNISLKYWMNNRTLIRAEYGLENREWWNIQDIELENGEDSNTVPGGNSQKVTFKEEKDETSSLGISFHTNDYITITADYVDSASIEKDFSTIFGVEYKDEVGTVRYKYQVDFGEQKVQENVLEFGYKDLATFNATYKIFNPELIENQLKKSIWDFGIDFNLNDISTISLGYQWEQKELSDPFGNQGEDEESNIQAQLKIKF